MAIASGFSKQVIYKKETTWNTAAGASGGQVLRRVESTLSLKKETYESNEIRDDRQRYDYRHGIRSVAGDIKGELSPGTYKDFFAAALRKAFASFTAVTGASITIAGSGPTYTLTRGSGSWLTDGVKAGDIVKLTAGSFNAANLNKNLFVTAVTSATVLTVMPLNGVALVAEGPISSATLSEPGKKCYAPASGFTDDSFSIEHWFSDISQSELFTGCKVNQISVDLPSSGLATITLAMLGAGITTAASEYNSSPTGVTSTKLLAAVNGLLMANGTVYAIVSGMSLSIKDNMSSEAVVGSNTFAGIVPGRIEVEGQFTALFLDNTLRDLFINETESSLVVALSADNTAGSDFIAFNMPRIKLGGADKDDGEKSIVQTFPFTALYNAAGGSGVSTDQTTIAVQDSQA